MTALDHECIDCRSSGQLGKPRKIATTDGQPKRCATHLRAHVIHTRKVARAGHVERTYGIPAEEAHELYLYQDGRCWLCRKATGATKALAVDHDHKTGEVRGRLCGPCNRFIGTLGDSAMAALRLHRYLTGETPYRMLKARQALAAGHPNHNPVVHRIQEVGGGALLAFWTHDGVGQNYSARVRTADGEWTTL